MTERGNTVQIHESQSDARRVGSTATRPATEHTHQSFTVQMRDRRPDVQQRPAFHQPAPPSPYGTTPLVIPEMPDLPPGHAMDLDLKRVAITCDNQIVGRMVPADDAPSGTWSVKSIFIVPEHRGQGLGRAMVAAYAKTQSVPLVYPNDVTDEGAAFFDSMMPRHAGDTSLVDRK